jgi:hypothetical protein
MERQIMNEAYLRKLISDEFRETLLFCGFVDNYHCKTKEVDTKGKTRYTFNTSIGPCMVYGSKSIYVNGKKFPSLTQARYELGRYLT